MNSVMDGNRNVWLEIVRGFTESPCSHRYFFAISLFLSLLFLLASFNVPILDGHSFRQTQTAISAYWLEQGGALLDYLTPVGGTPWQMPFEFPLFQWLVAILAKASGLPLDFCGRLVNWIFTVAVLIPAAGCLMLAGVDRRSLPLTGAVYLLTPQSFFWGRCFLIEGAALFFTVCFLFFALRGLLYRLRPLDVVLATVFLLFALLQKSTTVLPVLFPVGLSYLWQLWRGRFTAWVWVLALGVSADLAVYLCWVHYTDIVKAKSIIGAHLTSAALQEWNFGTLRQRFSADLWLKVLWGRLLSPFLFGYVFLRFWRTRDRLHDTNLLRVVGALLLLGIMPLLVFTNLHIHHDYYQCAISIYFSVAAGIVTAHLGLKDRTGRDRHLPVILLGWLLIDSGQTVVKEWTYKFEKGRTIAIARYLNSATPVDQPIVVFGYDWSAEVPYYSQRKAAVVPEWGDLPLRAVDQPAAFTGSAPAAYVVCPVKDQGTIYGHLQARGYWVSGVVFGCKIFLRS